MPPAMHIYNQGRVCCEMHVLQVNPYEPEMNWFTDDKETMPLSAAPEPKRRFIPSKWEEKK